ncbi:MAG TPA: thiamine pyrophosphate-dependent enzyme, partial [Methanospirillum sp.]|nr:thiamine pyrophosphate-dependent enzyme [Methanospirillum sp.]
VYGLTTGQYTPTSPYGYRGRSTPGGIHEYPLNIIEVMLGSGASFVARAYSRNIPLLKRIFHEAILHRGFAHIDVLQICATFFNMTSFYDEHVYETSEANVSQFDVACRTGQQWNYSDHGPIPLGIFYKTERPSLPEKREERTIDRKKVIQDILIRNS